MKPADYLKTQIMIMSIGKSASVLDIDGFLAEINRAETTAPMVDPTLYKKSMDNIQAIKKLAEAIRGVQDEFNNTIAAVMKTAARGDMKPFPPLENAAAELKAARVVSEKNPMGDKNGSSED